MNIDMNRFSEKFAQEYEFLYQNGDNVAGYAEAVAAFDQFATHHGGFVGEFAQYRGDCITSGREAAAFMLALDCMADDEVQFTDEIMVNNAQAFRAFYTFTKKNISDESITVEFTRCFGFPAKNMGNWWSVKTYVTNDFGECYGKYNPQITKDHKIDFSFVLPATEENKMVILEEVYRRFERPFTY